MEFGSPMRPSPTTVLSNVDAGHNWVMFLAPASPLRQHMPNEPYYYDLVTGLSTWTRPFDYRQPEDAQEHAEKLVREYHQKIRQQARQRAQQDRPLRKRPETRGTWATVETTQGRVYYYDEKSGMATWQKPQEIEQMAEQPGIGGTEMDAEDAEWMMEQMMMEQQEEEDTEPSEVPQAEVIPRDRAISEFKQMLGQGPLNIYGTWDSQIPVFQDDPRFLYIQDASERQDLFDQVCGELVSRKRAATGGTDGLQKPSKKPRAALGAIGDPFDQLLVERVTKKTSFARFCQKHLKDPRYLSVKTSREREKRFLRHIEMLDK